MATRAIDFGPGDSGTGAERDRGPVPPISFVAPAAPAAMGRAPAMAGGYGTQRANWAAIAAIGAAHAAIGALLLSTGTIDFAADPPPLTIVEIRPDAPEPIPLPPAPPVPLEIVPVEVFAPQVIVETPLLTPPPSITVTDVPPPPKATLAATPDAPPVPAAPVTPPDFAADQLNNPGPRYPVLSRRAKEQGTVMLKVLVSADGRAQDLAVATTSGFKRLDDAALATVKRWRFVAAQRAGRAVAAWVLVPVTFALG